MDLIRVFCIALTIGQFTFVFGGLDVGRNLTDFTRHRERRGLIFTNGGINKLVIGPIIMIPFGDPVAWRSMICGYNFHVGDYVIPTTPLYPWDKWENIYARSQSNNQPALADSSREFIYLALEYFMEKTHGNGRACLLRSICENAQIHRHMDLFGEILNVILTPGQEDIDDAYKDALRLGRNGVDCLAYYRKCPKGLHFFDQFMEEVQ